MANEEFDDEIWTRSEGAEKRAAAKAASLATRNMTTELGVFTIGLGIIIAALFIFAAMISNFPDLSVSRLAVGLTPSLLLVLPGIYVLVSRTKRSVNLAKWIVTAAFVIQALVSMNLINWLISAGCLYLVWRTAGQAMEQLH